MAAARSPEYYVRLAKTLPPRLTQFLSRYPPKSILPATIANDGSHPQANWQNPFMPHRHPITKATHDPKYSLRRQAELFKIAREYGVEGLLPRSEHKGAEAAARKEELGLRVKGTGIGQRVKGKKWERKLGSKMEKRAEAMQAMAGLVRDWREKGKSRGWTKWPK